MKQGELVKRGFFNNKVVNEQFLEAQREKFKKPQSEFDTEKMLKSIQPRDTVKRKQIKEYLVTRVDEFNRLGKKSLAAAYQKWIAQFDVESLETQINSDFTVDFQKWLLGVGKPEDHQRTPWGKQRVHDKECNAYLSVFLDARFEFTNKLQEMLYKAKGLGGLEGIEEYYMFFKYIVRGGWDDPKLFADWLSEWRSWAKLKPDGASRGDPGLPIEPYLKDDTTDRTKFENLAKKIEDSVSGKNASLKYDKSSTTKQIEKERELTPNPDPAVAAVAGGGQAMPPPQALPAQMVAQAAPQNLPPPPPPPAPVVNVQPTPVNVAAPNVNVAAPVVNVPSPVVNVPAPVVNVAAPNINVQPTPVNVNVPTPIVNNVVNVNLDPVTNAITNLRDTFTASLQVNEQRWQQVAESLQTSVNLLQSNRLPSFAPPSTIPPIQQQAHSFPPVDTLAAPLATYLSTVLQRSISNIEVQLPAGTTVRGVLPEGMQTIYTQINNPYQIVSNDISVDRLSVNVVPRNGVLVNDLVLDNLTVQPVPGENLRMNNMPVSGVVQPVADGISLNNMPVTGTVQPVANNIKLKTMGITDETAKIRRQRAFNTARYGSPFNVSQVGTSVAVTSETNTPLENTPAPAPETASSTPASASSDDGQTKLDKFTKVGNKLKDKPRVNQKSLAKVIDNLTALKTLKTNPKTSEQQSTASTIELIKSIADVKNPELSAAAVDLAAAIDPSLTPLIPVAGDPTLLNSVNTTLLESAQATNEVINNQRIEDNALTLNATALQTIASHENTNVPLENMIEAARTTRTMLENQRNAVLGRIPDNLTMLQTTLAAQYDDAVSALERASSAATTRDAQGLISTAARLMENVDQNTQSLQADTFANSVMPVAAEFLEDPEMKLRMVRRGIDGAETDEMLGQIDENIAVVNDIEKEMKEEKQQEKGKKRAREEEEPPALTFEQKISSAVSTFSTSYSGIIAKIKGKATPPPTTPAQIPASSSSASAMPTPKKRKGASGEATKDENQKGASTPGEKSVNVIFKTAETSYQHDSDLEEFQESYFDWFENKEKIEAAIKEITEAKHKAKAGNVTEYHTLIDTTINKTVNSLMDIVQKNKASEDSTVEFYKSIARQVVPSITDKNLDSFIKNVVTKNIREYQTSLKNLQTKALTIQANPDRREKESFVQTTILSSSTNEFLPTSLYQTYLANIETGIYKLVNDLQPTTTSSSSNTQITTNSDFFRKIKQELYSNPKNKGTSRMYSLV